MARHNRIKRRAMRASAAAAACKRWIDAASGKEFNSEQASHLADGHVLDSRLESGVKVTIVQGGAPGMGKQTGQRK